MIAFSYLQRFIDLFIIMIAIYKVLIVILTIIAFVSGRLLKNGIIEDNFKHCELNQPLHHIDLNSLCDNDGLTENPS